MRLHLHRSLEALEKQLRGLSSLVEGNLSQAIRSLVGRDPELAQIVVARDQEIDQMEVQIEEMCLQVLALHQPVAGDLRLVAAIIKINTDLERIGDLTVNIAQRARFLSRKPKLTFPFDVVDMAEKARAMLRDSLEALIDGDSERAKRVLEADDEVDALHRQMHRVVQEQVRTHPAESAIFLQYLSIGRYLERIADHATNIAEDVIYVVDGEIVRHGINDLDDA